MENKQSLPENVAKFEECVSKLDALCPIEFSIAHKEPMEGVGRVVELCKAEHFAIAKSVYRNYVELTRNGEVDRNSLDEETRYHLVAVGKDGKVIPLAVLPVVSQPFEEPRVSVDERNGTAVISTRNTFVKVCHCEGWKGFYTL